MLAIDHCSNYRTQQKDVETSDMHYYSRSASEFWTLMSYWTELNVGNHLLDAQVIGDDLGASGRADEGDSADGDLVFLKLNLFRFQRCGHTASPEDQTSENLLGSWSDL